MGNLYTDNLIGTVIGLSVADDWEGAKLSSCNPSTHG